MISSVFLFLGDVSLPCVQSPTGTKEQGGCNCRVLGEGCVLTGWPCVDRGFKHGLFCVTFLEVSQDWIRLYPITRSVGLATQEFKRV